jgi:hypothetical protein
MAAQYEFQLISADGSLLRQERRSPSDLRTVWERVFVLATAADPPGSQVRVLDERGGIIIGIGAVTAATLAKLRVRGARADAAR